jgi:hypothetical protein
MGVCCVEKQQVKQVKVKINRPNRWAKTEAAIPLAKINSE